MMAEVCSADSFRGYKSLVARTTSEMFLLMAEFYTRTAQHSFQLKELDFRMSELMEE